MKLVILTQPKFFVEEDKIITALFDEGMDILHLQKPDSEPVYCERLLSLLPNDCHSKIRVHEHYYLKQEFDLKGIHISNPDTPTPEAFKRHVTRSTNRISDLKEMKKSLDVNEVGGTALIGISRPVIKAHGSSNAASIFASIRQAKRFAESGIIGKIEENIEYMRLDAEHGEA